MAEKRKQTHPSIRKFPEKKKRRPGACQRKKGGGDRALYVRRPGGEKKGNDLSPATKKLRKQISPNSGGTAASITCSKLFIGL